MYMTDLSNPIFEDREFFGPRTAFGLEIMILEIEN